MQLPAPLPRKPLAVSAARAAQLSEDLLHYRKPHMALTLLRRPFSVPGVQQLHPRNVRELHASCTRAVAAPGGGTRRRSSSSWGVLGSAKRPNPPPRSSHTVTRVGTGQIAVFGGEDEPRHAFDPLVYIFDGDTWTTRGSAVASSSPHLLLGHGAASVGNTLYVFGGRTGGTNCADDPDMVIHSETETSTLLALDTTPAAADAAGWEALQAAGGGPDARSFHAMTSLDDKIYVFGGCGTTKHLLLSLSVLKLILLPRQARD